MTDSSSTELSQLAQTVRDVKRSVDILIRSVQGEIDAGNVGLVRRVSAIEARQESDRREIDGQLVALKLKMAGYGFLGSSVGGGLLVAILQAADASS